MSSILLLFIDGIGLGAETETNPFWTMSLPAFELLAGGQKWTRNTRSVQEKTVLFQGIDAQLGLPGLPQSGTGQATLFTGVNCAKAIGKHYGPYPHSGTFPIIAQQNVFTRVGALGGRSAFANAYPSVFFENAQKRNRWPVTTRSCREAGIPLRTMDDLEKGQAVAADITGQGLRDKLHLDLDVVDEATAAERLSNLASQHAFTAFEYFLTDRAGHRMSSERAAFYLHSLESFVRVLSEYARSESITLLITSDHGNLEDLSVKTHTLNDVPFAAVGPLASKFQNVASLTDVTPAIVSALST